MGTDTRGRRHSYLPDGSGKRVGWQTEPQPEPPQHDDEECKYFGIN